MVLEGIILSETNQTEKDKDHMTSFVCGNLKTNELKKSRIRPINTENKLKVARGKGIRKWAKQVKGSGRYRFPVME